MTVYVFHISLAQESLFWSALLEQRGYIGLKIIKTIRGKKKNKKNKNQIQIVARWGNAPNTFHRRPGRSLLYVTERIPSSQCTHWCGSTREGYFSENDARLVCHQLMLGCQATFIILFELSHVDCPKLPMQVSGGAAIVGSDRLDLTKNGQ